MRSSAGRAYSLLFFLSGATGLVYELLWVRLLYQSFGSTIQSVTTVVAAFMGGLGLGAWWLGRRADRHSRPAALYGWLEIAIGVFGVLSPVVLALAHRVYVAFAGSWQLGGAASVALRFGLAALVLLVPTTLMGGTLPVLTRAFVGTDRIRLQHALGRLYGLNTLGAMVGTALTGFFLIEHVGVRASLWGTASVNLALGVTAIVLARPLDPVPVPVPAAVVAAPTDVPRWLRSAAIVLLVVTAFTSLLAEIAWTRVLVMIVGGSTYAFTLVLLVFLLGIGVGSAWVARQAGSPRRTAADAAVAQGVVAVGSALVFFSLSLLPEYIILVFQPQHLGATARLALLGGAVVAVVLVPAIGMGMTFPLLTQLVAREGEARSADVGRAYGLNTLGSIAGAVLTGFVFVAVYGTQATLRVGALVGVAATVVLAVGAAAGASEASAEHRGLRSRVLAAGLLAAVGLTVAVVAPGWDARLIDLAPAIYGRAPMAPAARHAFLEHRGARQLAFTEGRNATVSVWEASSGRTLRVNGKVDASDATDMGTQVMLGLAPLAARPNARSVMVIGFGSGVTARVVAQVPGVQHVRVVEIEPAVLAMSGFFNRVNDSVLARPSVAAVVDDARSALQLDATRYDVIVSEPSNPWSAGVATLYTPEFFRIVRSRLADDGVFCQWVQLYELPLGVVAAIVRNVRAVFPHVQVWFGGFGDIVLLGSGGPLRYDSVWLERLLGPNGAVRDLAREYLGVDASRDYFGRLLLGDSGAARLATRATVVHRDDRPELEFVAARRFLDSQVGVDVFDSLVAFGTAADHDSAWKLLLAKAFTVPRWDPVGLPYVNAARRLDPHNPYWTVQLAGMLLNRGESASADSALASLVAGRRDPDAALLSGMLALGKNQTDRAGSVLEQALAGGADTAETRAALAVVAARNGHWADAAAQARGALVAARGTLRHPDPRPGLTEVLTRFALRGPPGEAQRLLAEAVARRPNWAVLHELHALAALRAGDCATGLNELLELLQFGIESQKGAALVQRCHRGETP
jgi:spermidine synthase